MKTLEWTALDYVIVVLAAAVMVLAFSVFTEWRVKKYKKSQLAQKEHNIVLGNNHVHQAYRQQFWELLQHQKLLREKVEDMETARDNTQTDKEFHQLEKSIASTNANLQRNQDGLIALRMLIRKAEGTFSLWQDGDPHPIREMSKWKFTRERRIDEYKKRGILGEHSLAADGSIRDWRDQRRLV